MLIYRTPGVYFEWSDTPPPAIGVVRTDIAGFVGIAERGPLHQPIRVESWAQFSATFGSHIPQGYLAYAVDGFFANGGQTCWVVRAADPDWVEWSSLDLLDERGWQALRLTAASPGVWGSKITVEVLFTGNGRFTLTLRLPEGLQEVWRELSLEEGDERHPLRVLNPPIDGPGGSSLVRASIPERLAGDVQATLQLRTMLQAGRLAGGSDGVSTLRPEHLSGQGAPAERVWGLAALEKVKEVAIVCMPDLMPPTSGEPPSPRTPEPRCDGIDADAPPMPPPRPEIQPEFAHPFSDLEIRALQYALIGHCEKLKDRVTLLDPRLADSSPQAVAEWRKEYDSTYAALYFPWLRVPDPLRLDGLLRTVPPCGYMAGVYARAENRSGVHKPPANELLQGVQDLVVPVEDLIHGYLNDNRVNVIRAYPGRGLRVAGARTLSSDSLWRYVNVRRLLIMIERAIEAETQWLVFEPNNPELWRDVDRVVRGFLNRLWQRGMLEGATAEQAYSVVCDQTSNPANETEAGRLITIMGVQPPWPAEFVVVRIGKTEAGLQIEENRSR
jgi:hypothetical protein